MKRFVYFINFKLCLKILLQVVQPLTTGKRTHRLTLRHIGQTEGWMITSGDVSSDGKKVLLRNYQGEYLQSRYR